MGLISKDDWVEWRDKQGWCKVNEVAGPQAKQVYYLTPAGRFVIEIYEVPSGNLVGILQAVAPPPPTPAQGLDLRNFRGGL